VLGASRQGGSPDPVGMRATTGPGFRLQFPISEIGYWADRYSYVDDAAAEAIGEAARRRGWYTRDEFLTVTRWKSPRTRSRCEQNDAASVKSATRLASRLPTNAFGSRP
jgi:hypothetical protein